MPTRVPKSKFKPHIIRPASNILVSWSPSEDIYARKIMRESEDFFKTYGQGRQPYMIDIRHYKN